ncbi:MULTISPECIES: chorismate-binding protein [Micrococcaceae]|uniref:chorismate-binding protein n=1 Tax=Micrococcaceae TaxID=1268 RepID=UPI001F531F5D|nr:chorismate-binding protein [Glutamicibacter sp. BW78]
MARRSPVIIAVDGRSGAGKSTLALELATSLRIHRSVSLFHLEDIYTGWDGLEGGRERYVTEVLDSLHWGEDARWTSWDWVRDTDGERRTTVAADVVIVEGVGASCTEAVPYLDASIWVEVEDDVRRRRALARDGDTFAPHWERWAAQEQRWLDQDPVIERADVIVANLADGSAPPDALRALTQLPVLQEPLRHELQAAAQETLLFRRIPLPEASRAATSLFERLCPGEHAVLLESSNASTPGSTRNRFSILADDSGEAAARVEHHDGLTQVVTGCARARLAGPFFAWLDRNWGTARLQGPEGLDCEFVLGWLGWLGYELGRESGAVPSTSSPTPDAALLHPGRAIVLDHERAEAWLLALEAPDARDWLDSTVEALQQPLSPGVPPDSGAPLQGAPPPGFAAADTREEYLAKILAAQDQITAGNSYEICLTTALAATAEPGSFDPWQLYLNLRETSPAPFAHYIRWGGIVVASSSPERFLSVDAAGLLRAEPIKGTRPRSEDPVKDSMLALDLATAPKDRAENIMIVDLLRNDLSRCADPSSLRVPRLCAVESYATVHQLVSTIEARLLPDASRAEAVAAAFPPGSMTGAPKISTMAILDRLEEGRPRGVYSGAVGYFSHSAAADLAVVIRTLVARRDPLASCGAGGGPAPDGPWQLSLGLGGAITADSDPAAEWEEVKTKSRGVLSALGAEFGFEA